MANKDLDERIKLIDAIKTPLAFFTLVVAVVEVLFLTMFLNSSGSDRTFLLYAMFVILLLLIGIVAGMAIFRPEELLAKNPFQTTFAAGLGEELFGAINPLIFDLDPVTQEGTYPQLKECLTTSPHAKSASQKRFCRIIAETVIRRAQLSGKRPKIKDVVR